jgi:hypothetical protein
MLIENNAIKIDTSSRIEFNNVKKGKTTPKTTPLTLSVMLLIISLLFKERWV